MKRKRSNSKTVVPYEKKQKVEKLYVNPVYRRRNRVEKKFIDSLWQGAGFYILGGTFTKTLINPVVTGSDENTRIGRETTMKSIFLRGTVTVPSTTTGYGNIRTMIIYDKQSNAAVPVTLDAVTIDSYIGVMNLNNRKRFQVLWDNTQKLSASNSDVDNSGLCTAELYYYKKVTLECEFNGTNGGTVADFTKGSLYMFTCTDNAAGGTLATTAPSLNLVTRIRFQDDLL